MELLFTDLEKTEAGAGLGTKSRVQLGLVESEMPIIHSKANVKHPYIDGLNEGT